MSSFLAAVDSFFQKFADFGGRASRTEFGWCTLFMFVAQILAYLILSSWLAFAVILILMVPTLAVTARRLHDTNRSGWWQLLLFVPFLGAIGLCVLLLLPPAEPNRYGPPPAPLA